MQLEKVIDNQIVDRSFEVSADPAINLLIGWQSVMILALGFIVFWLIRDKLNMTKEFVGVMTHVNKSLDDIIVIVKTTTDEVKESENKILSQIKESIRYVEKAIERLAKL